MQSMMHDPTTEGDFISKGKRSTLSVDELRKYINALLANEFISQDIKEVLCFTLEEVLMKTENYNGFQYIDWKNGGFEAWIQDGRPDNVREYLGDEFNREY